MSGNSTKNSELEKNKPLKDIEKLEIFKSELRKYPTRPYIGAGTLVIHNDRILLIKRKYEPEANKWSIPWGHLLIGESTKECAVRETYEKTGIRVRVIDKVGFVEHIIYDADRKPEFHYIIICYDAKIIDDRFKGGIPELRQEFPKTLAVRFVPLDELKDLEICDSTREILSKPMITI